MNKMFEQRKEDLEKEINKTKLNIIENYIDNNNINNNNKKEDNIKNNNNNNIELKINKDEEITIFQKFENLLAKIIDKNDIDNKIKEELKQVSEKLMINEITPKEQAAKYFSEVNKYLKNEMENQEKIRRIILIIEKVLITLDEMEKELEPKIKEMKNKKKEKKWNKKDDEKIQSFRKEYAISEEDASDEKIKECLKLYNNDKLKAYKSIMHKIVNAEYKSNKNEKK